MAPGQLHAGRAAANDDESQVGGLLPGIRLEFSDLEGGQHAGADQGRVLDRLHAGREFVPLGMTEIIVHRARGQDQVVVGNRVLAGIHTLRGGIDARDLRHHHQGVGLATQDESDRLSNVRRSQGRRGHLVEKRLKEMVVAAVDEQHVHCRVLEGTGSEKPTETTPDDHDLGSPCHLQQMSPDWRPPIGSQVGLLRKSRVVRRLPGAAPGGWAQMRQKRSNRDLVLWRSSH